MMKVMVILFFALKLSSRYLGGEFEVCFFVFLVISKQLI